MGRLRVVEVSIFDLADRAEKNLEAASARRMDVFLEVIAVGLQGQARAPDPYSCAATRS
jgi:hypothetical protein